MADEQALLRFPGLRGVKTWEFTRTHGITPSVCVVTIAPQDGLRASIGDLEIGFGNRVYRFRDCLLDSASFQRTSSGLVWQVQIADRRWRWTGGQISGFYNQRVDELNRYVTTANETDKFAEKLVRTPKELARLCLDAMGEKRVNLEQMPDDVRPAIDWEVENPARALADLCDSVGCSIVLRLDDTVAVVRNGEGERLPESGIVEASADIDPPEVPEEIVIVGGPTRVQVELPLEAVGQDTDGTIKPIDDLSYKPSGGWGQADIPNFHILDDKRKIELARRSVFKWYRIVTPFQYTRVAGSETDDLGRILPLDDVQIGTERDEDSGVTGPKAAQIFGAWYRGEDELVNTADEATHTVQDAHYYDRGFSIDAARGIVKLSQPVYRITEPSGTGAQTTSTYYQEADLILRVAVNVRDEDTYAWRRREKKHKIKGGTAGLSRIELHEELVYEHTNTYSGTSHKPTGQTTNEADFDKEAQYYIDAILREYELENASSATYGGILPADLDGAIRQVSWQGGAQLPLTRVSRNSEDTKRTISYAERRLLERSRAVAKLGKQSQQVTKRSRSRDPRVHQL